MNASTKGNPNIKAAQAELNQITSKICQMTVKYMFSQNVQQ